MSARLGLLLLSFGLLSACSALSMPPPAQWHHPQRSATAYIEATQPAFTIPALSADSIADAENIGGDLLVDLAQITPPGDLAFDTAPRSGPLARINPASGEVRWRLERGVYERWTILAKSAEAHLVAQRLPANLNLIKVDLATGAYTTLLRLPASATAQRVGERNYVLEPDAENRLKVTAYDALDTPPRWSTTLPPPEPTGAQPERTLYRSRKTLQLWSSVDRIVLEPDTGATLGHHKNEPPTSSFMPFAEMAEGLLVNRRDADGKTWLVLVGPDGTTRWSQPYEDLLVLDGEQLVVRRDGQAEALDASGATRWRAPLTNAPSGRVELLRQGDRTTMLIPQAGSLLALTSEGKQLFALPKLAVVGDENSKRDQVWCERDRVCFWDTLGGITAFSPTGEVLYRFAVRSMSYATREGRYRSYISAVPSATEHIFSSPIILSNSGGTMIATAQLSAATSSYITAMAQINAMVLDNAHIRRRLAQHNLATRYAQEMMSGPYIIRRLSWDLGEGVLIVRKADGAFAEIVLGPSEAYSDEWRLESLITLASDNTMLVTAHAGNDPSRWSKPVKVLPGEVVLREVMGFDLKALRWRTHAEYSETSVVPEGSF